MDITVVPDGEEAVGKIVSKMENAVKEEVSKIALIVKNPSIRLAGMDHTGYKAFLTFAVERGEDRAKVIDVAMKAMDSTKHQKDSVK